jgi:hypothetical protein
LSRCLQNASIGSTSVVIVTLGVVHTSRLRRAQVGENDGAIGWIANIRGTLGRSGDGNRCCDTSRSRNTRVSVTHVRLITAGIRNRSVNTLGRGGLSWIKYETSIVSTSIVVVTHGSLVGNSAKDGVCTHSSGGRDYSSLETARIGIASCVVRQRILGNGTSRSGSIRTCRS